MEGLIYRKTYTQGGYGYKKEYKLKSIYTKEYIY